MQHDDVTFVLVEDDDVDVIVLKNSFKRLKINNPIAVARDGVEALELLRGTDDAEPLEGPYVVLLDLNMPRMNGIEFLEEIRKDPKLASTIVFVLTTSDDERDKLSANNNDVAGYIVKSNDTGQSCLDMLKMLDRCWRMVDVSAA